MMTRQTRVNLSRRSVLSVVALLLAACASPAAGPAPEVRQALAPTGKLRVGVYPGSPTSMVRDASSAEPRGVTYDLGRELARRLGVPFEPIEFRRIAEVLDAMKAGQVDFTVSNATPARARDLDFTQPLLWIELGYLVPPGSPIASIDAIDRPGVKVGVTQGSTSQGTLSRGFKHASVVPVANLGAAIEMLSRGGLDAYATNKAILFEMADGLPGSRVLTGRWGTEQLAIGIPKGRETGLAWLRGFADDVGAQGLVRSAAARAGLRGNVENPAGR